MRAGSIQGNEMSNFWDGKIPCWESAYTQNEILLGIKRDCKNCKLFKICSASETNLPLEISSKDPP
jgi:hypothetical protein